MQRLTLAKIFATEHTALFHSSLSYGSIIKYTNNPTVCQLHNARTNNRTYALSPVSCHDVTLTRRWQIKIRQSVTNVYFDLIAKIIYDQEKSTGLSKKYIYLSAFRL